MNRKQRRNQAKTMRSREYKEQEQNEKYIRVAKRETMKLKDELWKENSLDWYYIQLWIMHTRFEWGAEKLAMLHEEMVKEFQCCQSGMVNVDDIKDGLKEIGIELK